MMLLLFTSSLNKSPSELHTEWLRPVHPQLWEKVPGHASSHEALAQKAPPQKHLRLILASPTLQQPSHPAISPTLLNPRLTLVRLCLCKTDLSGKARIRACVEPSHCHLLRLLDSRRREGRSVCEEGQAVDTGRSWEPFVAVYRYAVVVGCCGRAQLDLLFTYTHTTITRWGLFLMRRGQSLFLFELAIRCNTQVDAMSKWPGSVLASTSIIEEKSVVAYIGVMPR